MAMTRLELYKLYWSVNGQFTIFGTLISILRELSWTLLEIIRDVLYLNNTDDEVDTEFTPYPAYLYHDETDERGVYQCKICLDSLEKIKLDVISNGLKPSDGLNLSIESHLEEVCTSHQQYVAPVARELTYWIYGVKYSLSHLPERIKLIKDKLLNGVNREDAYAFQHDICKWALPRMEIIAKKRWGVSIEFDKELLELPDYSKEPEKYNAMIETAFQKQTRIYQEVKWAFWFGQYEYNEYCSREDWNRFQEAMKLFGQYFLGFNT